MSILDAPLARLDGTSGTLRDLTAGRPALLVNVASKCGLTPQYATLEELHKEFSPRGFAVVGLPCNQFGGQEPGSSEEIAEFCSATYGVTFPVLAKTDVNGPERSPLFEALTNVPDAEGAAGDVQWNFEKWLLSSTGEPVARFRPLVEPTAPAVSSAVREVLGS